MPRCWLATSTLLLFRVFVEETVHSSLDRSGVFMSPLCTKDNSEWENRMPLSPWMKKPSGEMPLEDWLWVRETLTEERSARGRGSSEGGVLSVFVERALSVLVEKVSW